MGSSFRPTNASFRKSVAVVSGSKTAGSKIQDLDDDDKVLKEVQGYVERINMSQVQSNGWICRSDDGVKYNCSISSELYTVPEGTTKKGYLYPKSKMTVTISINPVKRRYTIVAITDGFSNIKNWVKKDTIVVANNNSALQVSGDSAKLAYDDKDTSNEESSVTVSDGKVDINGQVSINGKDVDEILKGKLDNFYEEESSMSTYNKCKNGIIIEKIFNIANMTLTNTKVNIKKSGTKICHIFDENMWPSTTKSFRALTDDLTNLDVIKITNSGDVYIYTSGTEGKRVINTSITWVTNLADKKNVVKFKGTPTCKCDCGDKDTKYDTVILDYCPVCLTFGHIIEEDNKIKCESCDSEFCGVCGRYLKAVCKNTGNKLKGESSTIDATGNATCKCCGGNEKVHKEYMNYCPKCKTWDNLKSNTRKDKENDIKCSKCGATYCIFCGALNTSEATCKEQSTRLIFIERLGDE
jgi:hypothetical protein